MRIMQISLGLLILGIAIIVIYPFLGAEPVDAPQLAAAPWWIMPIGYFISLVGAAGLFLGWARKKETR